MRARSPSSAEDRGAPRPWSVGARRAARARAQPLGDDATRFVVDGPLEALVELGARPEHAGIDEAHDRTELAEPVLDRGLCISIPQLTSYLNFFFL